MFDPYWLWWWITIATFFALYLLFSILLARATKEGEKIILGYYQQRCWAAFGGFFSSYILVEMSNSNIGFGPGVVSTALAVLLWLVTAIGWVVAPLIWELPRFIPIDLSVRWFFPATQMEVLQLSRQQERAVDTLVLAHLSDLHLTDDLTIEGGLDQQQVRERAFEAFKWALERSDFVIVTGDITDRGRQSEWDQFLGIVDKLNVPLANNKVLLVPGNHDLSMTTTETYAPHLAFEKRAFTYVHRILRNAPSAWMMVGNDGKYTSVRSYLDDKAWYFDLYQKRPPVLKGRKVIFPEGLGALAPGYERTFARTLPLHCADFLIMAYPMVMRDDDKYLIVALNSASFLAPSLYHGAIGDLRQSQLDRFITLLENNANSGKCMIILVHHHIGFPAQKHREYVNAYGRLTTRALAFRHARVVARFIRLLDNCYLFHGHIHYPYTAQLGRAKVISGPSVTYRNGNSPQCFLYQIHPQNGLTILDERSFGT